MTNWTASLKHHECATETVYKYKYRRGMHITVKHQFDDYGNHRLVVSVYNVQISEWVPYQSVARLKKWAATTEYYKGMLPEVFLISELKQ